MLHVTSSMSGLSTHDGTSVFMNFDTKGWEQELDRFERETIPKATITALNRTAAVGRLAVQDEMEAKLDRVTPFAKRGVAYEQASSSKPSAAVIIAGKSWAKNSTPPANYLTPQFFGGQRNLKSFERQLISAGHMAKGLYAVPARDCPLDQYGNVRVALIVRILADLQIMERTAGYNRKRTEASTKRNARYKNARFFVPERGSHLHPGVWQRNPIDNSIKPMLLFVRMRSYTRTINFHETVQRVAEERFARYFAEAIGKLSRE
ncbi:hypothetical protein QUF18_12530 [Pseudochrobactrum kiredjianiae]|uniref:Uncharacterized protein n=2 Tax=Pseudochrobactrum kiredjianiae TaxID=386305 RepID=A0ABW3V1R1_9HYPH|nr:hypothetical protein [Pseudochrobactrum kiredjianiae]